MWNAVWHPTQAGPFVEVSRSFVTPPCKITAALAIFAPCPRSQRWLVAVVTTRDHQNDHRPLPLPDELFEWDTYFNALMLSWDNRSVELGLSSLIQITKAKTLGPNLDGHGFVPGYSKGGRWLSEDRTERAVGAQM